MEYYELHITFQGPLEEEPPRPWKYSQIDGDPVLGEGIKAYLTRQFRRTVPIDDIHDDLLKTSMWLKSKNFKVLREKIENVIWDTKTIPAELFNG